MAQHPDDELDDDRPPRRRRRYDDDEDEDDYDDRPRRRRRRPEYEDDAGLQYVLPVNTSAMAIIAGYLGLISVLVVPAPFALVLGILALVQLKKNPKMHGHGRAIFAIVMGALFTLGPAVLIAIAVISGNWK